MQIPQDIQTLENLVIHLATLYDQGLDCIDFEGNLVSDPHYDLLVKALKKKNPDSIAFSQGKTSPSQYQPTGDLVQHHPPMTSIAKADGDDKEDIYKNWISFCCKELGYQSSKDKFAQSLKRDGVAIRIYYENGKLTRAGLRSRSGTDGIDVTENIKYVQGVSQKLSKPWTLAIAGELECHLADFQKVQEDLLNAGEPLRKNPRNHTYGAINQQVDPKKTAKGRLSFTAYSIVNFDQAYKFYKTEVERAKWCNQVLKVPHVRVELHRFEDLQKLENLVSELPYEVDGIVLKVNNLEDQEQLGHSGNDPTGDPHGALAWKFDEKSENAIVKSIEWNSSRTGRVTPIAIFEKPILLAGTMVSRATCNNYGWLSRVQIGSGTVVEVIKAGKIIPKVINVVSHPVTEIEAPQYCPSCNFELKVTQGHEINQELMCLNENCSAKQIKSFVFFLSSLGVKGLGESSLEKMLESGIVKSFSDLYTLKLEDLINTGEFSERQATLALACIHMIKPLEDNDLLIDLINKSFKQKKKVPAWKFFQGLGISGAGKTVGKLLFDCFPNIEALIKVDTDQLTNIEGIGEKTAQNIVEWFAKNQFLIENLCQHLELEYPKKGKLTGKTFVLTGSFDPGKSYYESLITQNGGKVSGSVGNKTDYVVFGPNAGSKLEKAKMNNIPLINSEELKSMV